MVIATLFSIVFLPLGMLIGWVSHDVFVTYLKDKDHPFDDLLTQNPHPEVYDGKGKLIRDEYVAVTFDLGYSPDDFDPEDIHDYDG